MSGVSVSSAPPATPTNVDGALQEFWTSDRVSPPETMWDSWQDAHRLHVLKALMCVPEFSSLYEMGCGAGPNLRAIQMARPAVKLGGSEPNESFASWASEHLGCTIDRTGFPAAPGPEWNVALSCYALAYVPETTVRRTLAQLGTEHLVLAEPTAYVTPYVHPGLYSPPTGAMAHYAHAWVSLLADTGWRLLWRWPVLPHRHGLNTVIVAERFQYP